MKKLYFIPVVFILSLLSLTYSSDNGRILSIISCGPNDPHHPNVVQLRVEGGFSSGTEGLAAIRITEQNKPVIAAAFLAYQNDWICTFVLDPSDIYYPNRYAITRISFEK